MLRRYITLIHADPPHLRRTGPSLCRARDSRVAVPRAARLPGPARSAPGPETRRRRERREDRGDDGGRDETGGVVLSLHQPPPTATTSTTWRRPPLVLWQRRDHRRDLAHRARVSAARDGRARRRLSGLRRERGPGDRAETV